MGWSGNQPFTGPIPQQIRAYPWNSPTNGTCHPFHWEVWSQTELQKRWYLSGRRLGVPIWSSYNSWKYKILPRRFLKSLRKLKRWNSKIIVHPGGWTIFGADESAENPFRHPTSLYDKQTPKPLISTTPTLQLGHSLHRTASQPPSLVYGFFPSCQPPGGPQSNYLNASRTRLRGGSLSEIRAHEDPEWIGKVVGSCTRGINEREGAVWVDWALRWL